MSILSKLGRYVHTFGYSSSASNASLGLLDRQKSRSARRGYAQACVEQMEPRLLFTLLTAPGTYNFNDASLKTVEVTISGNMRVELYGATPNGGGGGGGGGLHLVDLIPGVPVLSNATHPSVGEDIFAVYIESSDINSHISINGQIIGMGGISSFFTGSNATNFPITLPGAAGQVYIGYHTPTTAPAGGTAPAVTNIPSIFADAGVISQQASDLAIASGSDTADGFKAGIYSANSIGKVLVDGIVTGGVNVAGSVGTFYAGLLLTGDATGNDQQFSNNFNVDGDIGSLLVRTSIGSNVTAIPADGLVYDTFTEIHTGGKIGDITVGDTSVSTITADDVTSNISLISLGYQNTENTTYNDTANTTRSALADFESGLIPVAAGDPFFNATFATATYEGALTTLNGAQSIQISGQLQGFLNRQHDNPVDYYAFGVLAGQTITVTEVAPPGSELGVFDSDGRLIFTGEAVIQPGSTDLENGTVTATFTADRPGAYRVAVGQIGDVTLTGKPSTFSDTAYSLSITGVSDTAIGGVHAEQDLVSDIGGTDPETQVTVPDGFTATAGSIGALVADAQALGFSLINGVTALQGSVLDYEGNTIGHTSNGSSSGFLVDFPVITTGGDIGYVHSSSLLAAELFAGTDIQVVSATGDLEGDYLANGSIGVIRAGSITQAKEVDGQTTIQVNADGVGAPGVIDLIDVTGDLGSLAAGGPRIETGTGGNVRFIQVGGSVFQDSAFGGGGSATLGSPFGDGGVISAPGANVSLTDDSGSHLVLSTTPTTITTSITTSAGTTTTTTVSNGTLFANITVPTTTAVTDANGTTTTTTVTPGGRITTYTYGIFGAGGVAIVKVVSDSNLTITSSTANVGGTQSAEIGDIILTGAGVALSNSALGTTGANGVLIPPPAGTIGLPTLPANTTVSNTTNGTITTLSNLPLLSLTLSGGVATSVFDIQARDATSGTLNQSTVNSITNSTGGDIVNASLNDVGNLTVRGNLGSTANSTGAAVNQQTVLNNAYPFVQQHTLIQLSNAVNVSATGSIGNFLATGSVGALTAGSGNSSTKGVLAGITGPVIIDGNVGVINIGGGIATDGFSPFSSAATFAASFSKAGVYVGGTLVSLTGNNADIRGQVFGFGPTADIESISLNGGSIVGADIGVVSTLAQSSPIAALVTIPDSGATVINSITINGNGGIIGTTFEASSIGSITVATTGFGVLNSAFSTLADGNVRSITAGGYGVRGDIFTGNTLGNINATGNGTVVSPAQFSNSVRNSENGTIDPFTGFVINAGDDLDTFLSSVGLGDSDYRTGIVANNEFVGQNLGNVTAFALTGSDNGINTFNFANSIGTIKVTTGVTDFSVVTGSLAGFITGGDATDINIQVAGAIGTIFIGGNFVRTTNGTSLIFAKGASASIKSLTVAGDFGGTLISNGLVQNLVIGTAGKKKGAAGFGNFTSTGDIELLAGSAAKTLTFNSGFAGSFQVQGSVSAVTFAQGLASTSTFTIHGSLGKLTIGGDKSGVNQGLRGNIVIQGSLGSLTGSGAYTGSLITTGNLGTVKFAGSMGGATTVNGSIKSIALTGDLTGAILATGAIGAVKISGSITSNASLKSNGGNLASLTIAKGGTIDGKVSALNIAKLTVPTLGTNANITATSIGKLVIQGNAAGGVIAASGSIASITAAGLSHTVITAGQNIGTIKIKGNIASSVIQSGITAGNDGIYGTADAGESVGLGTLGRVTIGSLTNSVVAAGGGISTIATGALVDSSISSGLVVNGAALQSVVADSNLLASATDIHTLRSNPTLFFGNIGSVSVANGAEGGLDADSNVTAGVSPGPNGIFGDPSDASIVPSAVGASTIIKEKIAADELGQVFVHDPA